MITGKSTARESNIELLRMLMMCGVIVLHYNNGDMGGAFKWVEALSVNDILLHVLESVFVCAVDLFVLMTGYFLCTSMKRRAIKIVELLVQVVVFSLGYYLLLVMIGKESLTLRKLIGNLIPSNYYVILYVTLYIISPYINLGLDKLSKNSWNKLMITLLSLFSVYPTMVDILEVLTGHAWTGLSTIGIQGSQDGYTIVNFVMLYIVGAYLRINELFKKGETYRLGVILFFCITVLTIWGFLDTQTAYEYCNPIVIIEAVVFFELFRTINCNSKIINILSKGSFTCYLLHGYIIAYIEIQEFVTKPWFIMLVHMLLSVLMIYLVSWLVYYIYNNVTKNIFLKVDVLLQKINRVFSKFSS